MVIPLVAGLLWLIHVGRCMVGRRSLVALLLWLAGTPVLCLVDYLVYVLFVPRTEPSGMADISPVDEAMVGNLFLGFGTWVVLLLLEPLVWLSAARSRRARRPSMTQDVHLARRAVASQALEAASRDVAAAREKGGKDKGHEEGQQP